MAVSLYRGKENLVLMCCLPPTGEHSDILQLAVIKVNLNYGNKISSCISVTLCLPQYESEKQKNVKIQNLEENFKPRHSRANFTVSVN